MSAKVIKLLDYLKCVIEGEDISKPDLGDIEKSLTSIVDESAKLGIESPIMVNLRKTNATTLTEYLRKTNATTLTGNLRKTNATTSTGNLRKTNATTSTGNLVFAANDLQSGSIGFAVSKVEYSSRSSFKLLWSKPEDCAAVKEKLVNHITLAIRFLKSRNGPSGELEVGPTYEAIEALFDEIWPNAKPSDQLARKYKQDAIKAGRGFAKFGFYRATSRWYVYKKSGISPNAKLEWRTLDAFQAKKVDAIFPRKTKGSRRNAT